MEGSCGQTGFNVPDWICNADSEPEKIECSFILLIHMHLTLMLLVIQEIKCYIIINQKPKNR